MKTSINWMKTFGVKALDRPIAEIVEKIGAQLGAVEEVTNIGPRYEKVTIVRIVSCSEHPNADRLHVCMIDDGGVTSDVERDGNGHIQVVCGAPNIREGLLVAWLPPGATVPETFDKDPFVLEARALRDVVSNGMLASPRELAMGDSHEGILEIDGDIAPGTSFSEAFGLNDHIIDIENKMFTHRPDCFGQLGVAREIAGITGEPFKSPEWYRTAPAISKNEGGDLSIEVVNEVPELVPRFMVVALDQVVIKPSPVWLQTYLSRVGVRPINNVVDITNYLMLLTGQPLHAYDYDKLKAEDANAEHPLLTIRKPHEGETLTLLSGKTIEPNIDAIMIATRDKLVGLGGVMGGGSTEIDEKSTRIVLECATFDMYAIRKTSMAHGLFTDAVTRFNKGQSPLQNNRILAQACALLIEHAQARIASDVVDSNSLETSVLERESLHDPVVVSAQFINARLGLTLSAQEITSLLANVEFSIETHEGNLQVTAPFWRTDITIPEDVVEEVGRLLGYDHLPLTLPKRTLVPEPKNKVLTFKAQVRSFLSRAGANEVLTYSFVHGNLFDKVGQDRNQAFQLSNAMSPELQYYRTSMLPSLLDKVHANIRNGYSTFALFEMGKTHAKNRIDSEGLPEESQRLALVFASTETNSGAAYYEARQFLVSLADASGVKIKLTPMRDHEQTIDAVFDPSRTALISVDGTDEIFGVVGELNGQVRKHLKLPEKTAAFEFDLISFMKAQDTTSGYRAISKFPRMEQDVCFKVSRSLQYGDLFKTVSETLENVRPDRTSVTVAPIDIYERADDVDHKQITFRLTIAHFDKTMREEELTKIVEKVADVVREKQAGERV